MALVLMKPSPPDTVIATAFIPKFAAQIVFLSHEGDLNSITDDYYLRVNGSPGKYTLYTAAIDGAPGSLQGDGRDIRDILISRSIDRGENWSPPTIANSDLFVNLIGQDNRRPAVTVNGAGTVHVFWYASKTSTLGVVGSGIMQSYFHSQADGRNVPETGTPAFSFEEIISSDQMYFDRFKSHFNFNYGAYNIATSTRGRRQERNLKNCFG